MCIFRHGLNFELAQRKTRATHRCNMISQRENLPELRRPMSKITGLKSLTSMIKAVSEKKKEFMASKKHKQVPQGIKRILYFQTWLELLSTSEKKVNKYICDVAFKERMHINSDLKSPQGCLSLSLEKKKTWFGSLVTSHNISNQDDEFHIFWKFSLHAAIAHLSGKYASSVIPCCCGSTAVRSCASSYAINPKAQYQRLLREYTRSIRTKTWSTLTKMIKRLITRDTLGKAYPSIFANDRQGSVGYLIHCIP